MHVGFASSTYCSTYTQPTAFTLRKTFIGDRFEKSEIVARQWHVFLLERTSGFKCSKATVTLVVRYDYLARVVMIVEAGEGY